MLVFADWFFVVFHSSVVLFNLFGWIWQNTRKANLALLTLTAASWFILGIWYGIGYCPLTDWHWDILKALGNNDLPNSYIKYLIDRIVGTDLDAAMVDSSVAIFFGLAVFASIFVNFRKKPNADSSALS